MTSGGSEAQETSRWRRIVADVTPLRRSPPYRRLFFGQTCSVVGTQATAVAAQIQVYRATHSSFAVGLLGLCSLVGLAGMGLLGGAIADAVDRRRLALATSTGLLASSVTLVVLAALRPHLLWPVFLIVGVQAALFGIDAPARGAIIPRLVGPDLLPAANALSQITQSVGLTGGPLLAGLLVSTIGLQAAYGFDALSYLAVLYATFRLPPQPPAEGALRAGVASVAEGFRYLRRQPVVSMTFLIDINAMVFGMPRALFPAIATSFYKGGAGIVGLLNAAPAMGALVGALFGGWFGRVQRQGRAVVIAVCAWGLAVTAFGLTRTLWLGVAFLAAAGAADMISAVYRTTILQAATPDAMRGRLQGVMIVVVAGGPRLGDVEAGAVATLVSPGFSVLSGGIACVVGALALSALVPAFARYDARTDSTSRRSATSPA